MSVQCFSITPRHSIYKNNIIEKKETKQKIIKES